MFQILGQQAVSDLINRFSCLISNSFKTAPYRYGAADMISHNTRFAALTALNSRKLSGFTVKLLCFPIALSILILGFK